MFTQDNSTTSSLGDDNASLAGKYTRPRIFKEFVQLCADVGYNSDDTIAYMAKLDQLKLIY